MTFIHSMQWIVHACTNRNYIWIALHIYIRLRSSSMHDAVEVVVP